MKKTILIFIGLLLILVKGPALSEEEVQISGINSPVAVELVPLQRDLNPPKEMVNEPLMTKSTGQMVLPAKDQAKEQTEVQKEKTALPDDDYERMVRKKTSENRQRRLREEQQRVKSTLELLEKAKQKGEIDEDTFVLYKFYDYTRQSNLVPEKYKSTRYERHGNIILPPPFLYEVWNNLQLETKRKIIEINWKEHGGGDIPGIRMDEPKDNEVVNTPFVAIKGEMNTAEIYSINGTWLKVSNTFTNVEQRKVNLIQIGQITSENTMDKIRKEQYLKTKEELKDKPGMENFFCPPAQNVYQFSEMVVLPSTGIWNIQIGVSNESGNSVGDGATVIYPPSDKADTTPPTIEVKIVEKYDENWSKGLRERFNVFDDIKEGSHKFSEDKCYAITKISDKNIIVVRNYINDSSIGECETGVGFQLLNLTKVGKNIFKIVAIDCYGNRAEKEIKLYYEPEKQ